MTLTITICAATCLLLIAGVLWLPELRIGPVRVATYWVVALLGACVLLVSGTISPREVLAGFVADTAVNPLKILVLFLSMTALSVFLDEVGIFRRLAAMTVARSRGGQWSLFWSLYVMVSLLTVFTSNDVIILTFTPFICYFARNANINPAPYLFAEFTAANTWSMALIIGNPTNIYLATSAGVDFAQYLRVMLLPTIAGGVTAFVALYILFHRQLQRPLIPVRAEREPLNRSGVIIGLSHFAACLILLVASSWVGLEMWGISLAVFVSLAAVAMLYGVLSHHGFGEILHTLRRLPWQLVPFVLSMFTLVLALEHSGATAWMASLLSGRHTIITYGVASTLASNAINNIPMSVLFSSIIAEGVAEGEMLRAVFASIVGSNIGALLSPIGALAGLMWASILRTHDIEIGFLGFVWRGLLIGIPTLFATLFALIAMGL
ncbi:MAG: hypothetical protein IJ014_03055 [Rikenellaceae bacterium]|nr:hypothetical protein [Rikenellaceae bacterium]